MTTHKITATVEGFTYQDLAWLIEKMDESGGEYTQLVRVETAPQDGASGGIVSLIAEFPGE